MSDETVEEVLQQCELKLSKLLSITREVDDSDSRGRAVANDEAWEEKLLSRAASDVRVKLADQEADGDDDDDFEEDMDEDCMNRKNVKYNAAKVVEEQQTKMRKKGKKKEAAAAAAH